MLSQLVRDLRLAARVLDQLDSSVEDARTLFEDTVDRARKAARGRLKLRTKEPKRKRWQGTAAHSLGNLTAGRASAPSDAVPPQPRPARSRPPRREAVPQAPPERPATTPKIPSNLLPEALELWRSGFATRIANRLARAGLRTWEEVLAHRPVARLAAIDGLGSAVVWEVRRVLAAKGVEDKGDPAYAEPSRRPALVPQRKRPTLDSLATEVAETLDRLGGSASLTELLRKGRGMSGSQVKRGLVALEEAGEIYRTGSRRSTRYHRFKKDDCVGAPWEVPAQ
jgi:hypothetical protein